MKLKLISISLILLLLFGTITKLLSQENISLSGKWRIVLDGNYKDWPEKVGISEGWYKTELPTNTVSMLNQIYFKMQILQ